MLASLFASSGRLKVTLQPSSLTAFIPYRFFATICAPKSANDYFHALKASLESVWSLKLCIFRVICVPRLIVQEGIPLEVLLSSRV